jgi:hypothetical protein
MKFKANLNFITDNKHNPDIPRFEIPRDIIYDTYFPKTAGILYTYLDEKVLLDIRKWFATQKIKIYSPFIKERELDNDVLQIPILLLDRLSHMSYTGFMRRIDILESKYCDNNLAWAYFYILLGNWMNMKIGTMENGIKDVYSCMNYCIEQCQDSIAYYLNEIFLSHESLLITRKNVIDGPFTDFFKAVFYDIEDSFLRPLIENDQYHLIGESQTLYMYDAIIEAFTKIFHIDISSVYK